ncbi:MAG: DUF4998 domain-containing protein [Chitinophagaceae bacterium]|nr:DUF4998 domain-containing protein [Chitinophagaceae bacterium]
MKLKNLLSVGILGSIGIFFLSFFYSSCTKMDYYYKDLVHIKDYVGKVDSVWINPGNNRVKVNWISPKDPTAQKVIVFWNNNRDSVIAPISKSADTSFVLIEGLTEGEYLLNVVTQDTEGNRSLPVELSTSVYGNNFQNSLRGRSRDHVVIFKDSVVVYWNESVSGSLVGVRMNYQNKDGEEVTILIPAAESRSVIPDMDVNKPVLLQSLFLPVAQALDTFYTSLESVNFYDEQLNTLVLRGGGDGSGDFIDFSEVVVYPQGYVKNQGNIDVAHLRGVSSKQNFIAITNDAGFLAFSTPLRDYMRTWQIRNDCKMVNLGGSQQNHAIYDGLVESDRAAMKDAYDQAARKITASGRLTLIKTGDIIFINSISRNVYIAIKVLKSEDEGNLTIEFKVSRN